MKENALGDVQKVDVGIALSHFDLTMQEEGRSGVFIGNDPKLEAPENHIYVISYERKS